MSILGAVIVAVFVPMSVVTIRNHNEFERWTRAGALFQNENVTTVIPDYGFWSSSVEIRTMAVLDVNRLDNAFPVSLVYPPFKTLNLRREGQVREWIAMTTDIHFRRIWVDFSGGLVRDEKKRYLAYTENVEIKWWVFGLVVCCFVALFCAAGFGWAFGFGSGSGSGSLNTG